MDRLYAFTRRRALASGVVFGAAAVRPPAAAQTRRDILSGAIDAQRVERSLLPRDRWQPWPTAANRSGRTALPHEKRKLMIEGGAEALARPWEVLPATLFLEYRRVGNRSRYEARWTARRGKLVALVLAECAEGEGRFLDEIANGVWLTCEESFWGLPAHLSGQKGGPGLPESADVTVDLFAAETSAMLAWILYLFGPGLEKVSPHIPERIHREIERRILVPALERKFGWMGYGGGKPNNWNPWICSNWLTSALLTDRDEKRRRAGVLKILAVLDHFLNGYDDDGGCDEGPGYWNAAGGALFDNLELLRSASGGAFDFYSVPLVREIGRYIYRAHIAGNYYTNFADASAVVHIDGNMVWRFGRAIGDPKMTELGAWAAKERESSGSLGRLLPRIFTEAELLKAQARETLVRDVWLPGTQVMAARVNEGSTRGLYLAAQGGHNAESHNHNDVGNFMVYADGKPAIVDVGVETYSAKTFSPQRYEIWTMQSGYHNLPTFDGIMQAAGRAYAAREVQYRETGLGIEFSLDIAAAYPKEAGLESWRRVFRFDRGENRVEVTDRWSASRAPKSLTFTLMTPAKMTSPAAGRLSLAVPGARPVGVDFDHSLFEAAQEEIPIEDSRLRGAWGDRLYRILLRARAPAAKGEATIRILQADRA